MWASEGRCWPVLAGWDAEAPLCLDLQKNQKCFVSWLSGPHGTSNFDHQSLIHSDLNYTIAHAVAEDETVAADQDADLNQNDLETDDADSDEHPIKIGEVNLCEIAEKIDWALNVDKQLSDLSKQQQEAILAIIEGDKYEPPVKRRRTMKKMKSSIFDYVRKKCYCVAFSPWQGR